MPRKSKKQIEEERKEKEIEVEEKKVVKKQQKKSKAPVKKAQPKNKSKQKTIEQYFEQLTENIENTENTEIQQHEKVTKKIRKGQTKKPVSEKRKKYLEEFAEKKKIWKKKQQEEGKIIWEKNSNLINFLKNNKNQKINSVKNQKSFTIMSWNINGIRAVLKKIVLQEFIDIHQPDVLCVNELKVDEETYKKDIPNFGIPGYYQYLNFCKPPHKGYSGVGIFTKLKPIEVSQNFGTHQTEGRCITIRFEKFTIVAIYSPHSGFHLDRLDFRNEFDQQLQSHIVEEQKKNKVIITGDFNVCPSKLDVKTEPPKGDQWSMCTKEERGNFQQLLNKSKLVDVYRHLNPTTVKYSLNDKKRIDFFLIPEDIVSKNKKNKQFMSDILREQTGSDHYPIILKLDI